MNSAAMSLPVVSSVVEFVIVIDGLFYSFSRVKDFSNNYTAACSTFSGPKMVISGRVLLPPIGT